MFPGYGAQIYHNDAGEVLGWDYPDRDDPYDPYDPDEYWEDHYIDDDADDEDLES